MLKVPKITSLQYLKENVKDEVDFNCLQINIKGFFKLILSFQVLCGQTRPNYPNNKFAISLQCRKKEVSNEIDFCMQISMKVSYK